MANESMEAVKGWLRRYSEAAQGCDALYSRVENMRVRIESAQTSSLDSLPHATGYVSDRMTADLARLEALDDEAKEARAHAVALYREIDAAIKQIKGPGWADKRAVLQVRYLDLEPWEGVTEVLFGRRDDFEERRDSFLRRVFKIHGAALAELSKIVPLQEGQENI